jgi:hypothetical protein
MPYTLYIQAPLLTAHPQPATQQLAEPDSPTFPDLWYTCLVASSDSLTLGFGLAG